MSKRFHIAGDCLAGKPYVLDEDSLTEVLRDFGAEDTMIQIQDLKVGEIAQGPHYGARFIIRLADDIPLTVL